MSVETRPVLPAELESKIKLDDASWVRVRRHTPLWRPLLAFMTKHASCSFEVEQLQPSGKSKSGKTISLTTSGITGGVEEEEELTALACGLGVHSVPWEGSTLYVSYQRRGVPVGTYDEAVLFEEWVIFIAGRGPAKQSSLHGFCEHVFKLSQQKDDNDTYRVYSWVVQESWWKTAAVRRKRPMESVVLPHETKERVLADIRDFKNEDTANWYSSHGIPYKRSYLLYGPPGTGKTSFLAAVASQFDLNLCFLQAGHPMLTDDGFANALNGAPSNSILVLEDIDSLFSPDRKSENKSAMSFSGMLNALDGCVSPHGQLFFLTTNHPERLDAALLRHGRVDVRAQFPCATAPQVGDMFRSFYPKALVEEVVLFTKALEKEVEGGKLNLAKLQDFFIQSRTRTSAEAVKAVDEWLKAQQEAADAVKAFEEKNIEAAKEKEKAKEEKTIDDLLETLSSKTESTTSESAPAAVVEKRRGRRRDDVAPWFTGICLGLVLGALIWKVGRHE